MKKYFLPAILAAFIFPQEITFAASGDAAMVLSVDPGVDAILEGKSQILQTRMEVPLRATVKSDATGHSQMIFPDDATITISPNTEVALLEFVDTPQKESIILNMTVGTMRIITGEVSKRNPTSFTVTTPQAIIGIRGTVVTIEVSGDMTRVYLSETSGRGVTVRNKFNGRELDLKTPGQLITVGPRIFDSRKAQRQQVQAFRAALLRPTRNTPPPARSASAVAQRRPVRLPAPGDLPFTTAITVAQMDEPNRTQEIAAAIPVGSQLPQRPSTPETPPATPATPPVTPVNPPQTPGSPPSTPENPPSAPENPPSTPENPPSTPENPPSTPENPPSTPENPPSEPNTPSTPDTPSVPDSEPTSPDVPPIVDPGNTPQPPDVPINPSTYKVTMPELAGNFSGNGTFNYYYLASPSTSFGSPQNGAISFTVPQEYISLTNDVYTINITDIKVPGYQNGVFVPIPEQGHNLSIDVNRTSGAITQTPGQTITTTPDQIRALLIRGNFNDNQSGILDTIHYAAGTGPNGEALRGRNQGPVNITKR